MDFPTLNQYFYNKYNESSKAMIILKLDLNLLEISMIIP